MGYIDKRKIQRIAEEFLTSGQRETIDAARSFFDGKMFTLGASFERGDVKREDLAQSIADVLKSFKIYLSSTEIRSLQKKIDFA
ncbi:MAG: hypothetical protein IPK84_00925 [Candidatus Moraniibacteriota bacterium]|nr:MAG: hypothetical protein IPK84_00925 [Candidatus Moranbacteria bacterium]